MKCYAFRQAHIVKTTTQLDTALVKVISHMTIDYSQGIVHYCAMSDRNKEEITQDFHSQHTTNVK